MYRVSQEPQGISSNSQANNNAMSNCSPSNNNNASQKVAGYVRRRNKRRRKDAAQHSSESTYLSYINAVLMHFSRRSTIHGLNHMAQAKSAKRRIFWILISLVASIGFFVNLYYLVEKYVQNPVLTNVFHDHTGFVYPDITICITNPLYFPPNGSQAYQNLSDTIEAFKAFKKSKNDFARQVELADFLFMRRKDIYSHPSWSAIISCSYMQKRCNFSHFEVRRIWPYGNCFTFNATKMGLSRYVMRSMQYNGFRPDFRIVVYKAISRPKSFRIDPHNSLTVPSGIMVMIHEANSYPHIGDSFIVDGCTQIDLKIVLKSHLKMLNRCVAKRSYINYYDMVTGRNQTYLGRQSDCVFEKVQTQLPLKCGCQWHTLPILSKYGEVPFCYSGQYNISYLKKCMGRAFGKINKMDLPSCYKDLCNHTTYSTVVSHSKFPAVLERNTHYLWLRKLSQMERLEIRNYGSSDLAADALLSTSEISNISTAYRKGRVDLLNVDFVERNFMMLRIVPASLFMDLVEEAEEYPLSRLMSDVGGCVGLWVGASLITIFEFVDLLMDFTEVSSYQREKFRKRHLHRKNVKTKKSSAKTTDNTNTNTGFLSASLLSNGDAYSSTVIPSSTYNEYWKCNMPFDEHYNSFDEAASITDNMEEDYISSFQGINMDTLRAAVQDQGHLVGCPIGQNSAHRYLALPEHDDVEDADNDITDSNDENISFVNCSNRKSTSVADRMPSSLRLNSKPFTTNTDRLSHDTTNQLADSKMVSFEPPDIITTV